MLFAICAGNELFLVALYLMKWVDTPLVDPKLTMVWWPWYHLTWASVLATICGPVWLLKNIINVVQLWKASKILVGVDLVERAMARRAIEAQRALAAKSLEANSTAVSEKAALKP
jgi:CDP-diacylglycerol--inositol 3-phosphatidyltransferase